MTNSRHRDAVNKESLYGIHHDKTDITVSKLCLGCMSFGDPASKMQLGRLTR